MFTERFQCGRCFVVDDGRWFLLGWLYEEIEESLLLTERAVHAKAAVVAVCVSDVSNKQSYESHLFVCIYIAFIIGYYLYDMLWMCPNVSKV